uniref:Uncharacterized protein n=1 Tax=Astyanax mexicanus TaxID=7994 RepID=A0A8B9HU45_ASTMX
MVIGDQVKRDQGFKPRPPFRRGGRFDKPGPPNLMNRRPRWVGPPEEMDLMKKGRPFLNKGGNYDILPFEKMKEQRMRERMVRMERVRRAMELLSMRRSGLCSQHFTQIARLQVHIHWSQNSDEASLRDDSYWNGNKKMQPESEGRISQASDYGNRQQGRFNDFSSRDRTRFPDSAPVQTNNFDSCMIYQLHCDLGSRFECVDFAVSGSSRGAVRIRPERSGREGPGPAMRGAPPASRGRATFSSRDGGRPAVMGEQQHFSSGRQVVVERQGRDQGPRKEWHGGAGSQSGGFPDSRRMGESRPGMMAPHSSHSSAGMNRIVQITNAPMASSSGGFKPFKGRF